jgi:NTE family protein
MDAKADVNSPKPDRVTGWRPERCDQIALIFQGGGALGAY